MEYKADSIFKNQLFNFSIQILNIIFPLIAIPYTTRLFGPDILGEINFANSIVQYFLMIAIAGIPVYATREIAKTRDNKDLIKQKFKELSTLQLLFTIFSLTVYLIFIFVVPSFKSQLFIYLFLGIQILSNAFNYIWFIQGVEKYKYASIGNFITKLINIILIFSMLRTRGDYYKYALIMGLTSFINAFINMIISKKLFKLFDSEFKVDINYEKLKIHITPILIFFLSDIAVKVYTAMDQTMLGILDSKESVGYYSMSIKLVKTMLTFVTSVAVVMLPRISNSIKNNKQDEVKKYIGISTRLVYLISIPAIFGIMAIGEEIITIYLGIEFLESILIFKLVSLLLVIIGLSNVFGVQVMIPYGKEKKFTLILSIAAVVNFILNLVLLPKFSYFGATYATLIAEGIVTIWMYFEVKKLVGNVKEVFKIWKMVIPSLVFYMFIKVVIKTMITNNIIVILISIPMAGLIYGIGLIVLKEELTMQGINKVLSKINKK